MTTRFRIIFILTLLSLIFPLHASAAKPDQSKFSMFFPADPLFDCGDFRILDDVAIDGAMRDFLDKDGNWVRSSADYFFDDDLYNENFPDGIHLTGNASVHWQWYDDGSFRNTGVRVGITVPGYGLMLFDAGQFGTDSDGVFYVHGHNQDWTSQDIDAICGYLDQ